MSASVDYYKQKIFTYLKKELKKEKRKVKLLDVGCGDGRDARIFMKMGFDVYGIDVYEHEDIKKILGKKFKKASIFSLPFKDETFDYVFEHDTLHHIDEKGQRLQQHIKGLDEIKRVCKKNGTLLILEANRFNPLFYPHMVLMEKHQHFKQKYFIQICETIAVKSRFVFFEAHVYPEKLMPLFKIYEKVMEGVPLLRPFIAYNLAILKKE